MLARELPSYVVPADEVADTDVVVWDTGPVLHIERDEDDLGPPCIPDGLAPELLEQPQIGLQRLERWHAFFLVLDDVPLDAALGFGGRHDRRPVELVRPEVGVRVLPRKRLHVHRDRAARVAPDERLGRHALHLRSVAGVELQDDVLRGLIGEAVPPVLAVDATKVRRVVVVPDAHLVRLQPFGHRVDLVGGLLQQVGRSVDLRGQGADDQIPVADGLVELHAGRELAALQLGEAMVKAARLQVGGIQVGLPLGSRPAERVFELDRLIAQRAERLQRPRDVLGQLQAHAPELRADGNLLPCGRSGASRGRQQHRGGGRAAEPESITTGQRSSIHEGPSVGTMLCRSRAP